jgi:acyl-CoA synthetase (AMP-forming)/AMP-acid ligase II
LARLDNDGYLFIVHRLKGMIITGENVYSKEVEDQGNRVKEYVTNG